MINAYLELLDVLDEKDALIEKQSRLIRMLATERIQEENYNLEMTKEAEDD